MGQLKLKRPPKDTPPPPPPPKPVVEELPDATPLEALAELDVELAESTYATHDAEALRNHMRRLVAIVTNVLE